MPSRIKHVAIMSQNAPRMFRFYEWLFDLRKAASEATPTWETEQGRSFGYPILASKRVVAPFDRIKTKYPEAGAVKRPSNRPFADYGTHDPEGNIFDLMQPGKSNAKGVWLDGERKQERWIDHVVVRALHSEKLAQFYVDVYQFEYQDKALEDPNFYLTDGKVNLVFAPWKNQDYLGTEHKGSGLDPIGFHVENVTALKNDLEVLAKADPERLAPKSPNLENEYAVVLGLLQYCRHGKHQLCDPEGNMLDVS